jgi:hypothetical protein
MFILGFVVKAFTDKMFNETRIELFFLSLCYNHSKQIPKQRICVICIIVTIISLNTVNGSVVITRRRA